MQLIDINSDRAPPSGAPPRIPARFPLFSDGRHHHKVAVGLLLIGLARSARSPYQRTSSVIINFKLSLLLLFTDTDPTQGDRDTVIQPAAAQVLRAMLNSAGAASSDSTSNSTLSNEPELPPPEVSLVSVSGAGHDLTWTHADQVARVFLEFFDAGGWRRSMIDQSGGA